MNETPVIPSAPAPPPRRRDRLAQADGKPLDGFILPSDRLSAEQVTGLFELFARHYDDVSRPLFEHDLAEKDHIIVLVDPKDGIIRGFSTQKVLTVEVDGRPYRSIFSGDTIIDKEFWGSQALVRTFAAYCGRTQAEAPSQRLFWFLISKGHRTYLYLPVFFREYFPRWDAPTPEFEGNLLAALAKAKFGDAFDPATGLIEFAAPHGKLKPGLAEIPKGRADDPRVLHFTKLNPRYAEGSELACLAEIAVPNIRSFVRPPYEEGLAAGPLQTEGGDHGEGAVVAPLPVYRS